MYAYLFFVCSRFVISICAWSGFETRFTHCAFSFGRYGCGGCRRACCISFQMSCDLLMMFEWFQRQNQVFDECWRVFETLVPSRCWVQTVSCATTRHGLETCLILSCLRHHSLCAENNERIDKATQMHEQERE